MTTLCPNCEASLDAVPGLNQCTLCSHEFQLLAAAPKSIKVTPFPGTGYICTMCRAVDYTFLAGASGISVLLAASGLITGAMGGMWLGAFLGLQNGVADNGAWMWIGCAVAANRVMREGRLRQRWVCCLNAKKAAYLKSTKTLQPTRPILFSFLTSHE